MTTIAWDGKTMAGDTGCVTGDLCSHKEKIQKLCIARKFPNQPDFTNVPHCVVGGAGELWKIQQLIRWLGSTEYELPPSTENKATILIVHPKHVGVFVLQDQLELIHIVTPFWAIGSGSSMAMGALASKASAVEAVYVVREYGCGAFGQVTSIETRP